ncbi:MAG: DEAD/DEAH box helicase [Chloroflexi bacterium]|nr:DEAD/DEAH box helicase [Chloroflexota bacterium]
MSTYQHATDIIPVVGCCVAHTDPERYPRARGVVLSHGDDTSRLDSVQVRWGSGGTSEWHLVSELRSGFRKGDEVQDIPRSHTRRPLGRGSVANARNIAGREQVLVQLHNTGETAWLPYQNLRLIRRSAPDADSAERFRLKALAYALDSWNQLTGALDRFDVDPLPHQIDLVHRIMTSDRRDWLIADDVGLGKTIEVGLLLAAKRRQARRVLVVCPAGMVQQWKDEMQDKFNEAFRIYGQDFNIERPGDWATHRYDKVIMSIDRAKSDNHLPLVADTDCESWDVVVFDEAHHLSKIAGQAVTQRYRLAERLRRMADEFIFLTGTPHQGDHERFAHLLRLLRPDLTRRLAGAFTDPSVVAEIVLRNRKSLVTDAQGDFLFRGQDTRRIEVPFSETARSFDTLLQNYLRHGYDAAAIGGNAGRAIGFVMTTYRKLASSSIAAIDRALRRRLARLQGGDNTQSPNDIRSPFGDNLNIDAFQDGTDSRDDLDSLADIAAASFFDDEQQQISELLAAGTTVKADDRKLAQFLSKIVEPLHQAGERLLIFTEYRATQSYLVSALEELYPQSKVAQINGAMDLAEKRRNIDQFNESAQFMVSTEAGGEGFNLHENCHILVNYDLPWNPARLVQRAGRLYRYGQQERVLVFNLMASDGFDSQALGKMLDRVDLIAEEMASVSTEFQEGLHDEIIGELLERIDMASILADNRAMDISRTDDEIETAIDRAKEARAQQEQLFARVEGFDPQAAMALTGFEPEDVMSFLEGVLPFRNIRIRERLYNGRVLELELPMDMRGQYYDEFENRTIVRVTATRDPQIRRANARPMDFASAFFSNLIDFAKSPEFKGEQANLVGYSSGALAIYKLRWQNDQGVPTEEQLLPIFLPDGTKQTVVNPAFFIDLLTTPAVGTTPSHPVNPDDRRDISRILAQCADDELGRRCTELRHPNDAVLLAEADIRVDV